MVVELNGTQQEYNGDKNVTAEEQMKFNDDVAEGRVFVPWKAFKHPQYDDIEIGGYRHDTNRAAKAFMKVEESHRIAMFVLSHAFHLPKMRVEQPEVIQVKNGLYRLHVQVMNERMIPTMAAVVTEHKLHRADLATIEGGKVIASGIVQDRFIYRVQMQENRPERLMVAGGIGGNDVKTLMFLVAARPGPVTFTYDNVRVAS